MSLCLLFTAQAQFLSPGVFDTAPDGYWVGIEEVVSHADGELDGLKVTLPKLPQYLNAASPKFPFVTPPGIVISFKLKQKKNAKWPMILTLSGMTTELKLVQDWNA